MEQSPQSEVPEGKKKTKSEFIRAATVADVIYANAKPTANGWRGFFHSNLFVALLMWVLSQVGVVAVFVVSYYVKTSSQSERLGAAEATLTRMDEKGTLHAQYQMEAERDRMTRLETRMDKEEELTRHIEVIETEHRYLRQDVENLKNGKK